MLFWSFVPAEVEGQIPRLRNCEAAAEPIEAAVVREDDVQSRERKSAQLGWSGSRQS